MTHAQDQSLALLRFDLMANPNMYVVVEDSSSHATNTYISLYIIKDNKLTAITHDVAYVIGAKTYRDTMPEFEMVKGCSQMLGDPQKILLPDQPQKYTVATFCRHILAEIFEDNKTPAEIQLRVL